MKRERRHELHRNELADWLNDVVKRVKPYSRMILVVVAVAGLGIAAYTWLTRQSAAQAADAWRSWHVAWITGRPADLEQIVRRYPGTDVAHWAAVLAGNFYLSSGCEALFQNKSTAAKELGKAVENFRMVQQQCQVPMLVEQASYGLARAYEGLAGTRQAQGEALDSAIEAYQLVVNRWPNGAYTEEAAHRLEALDGQQTRAFYDKFATFDPKPASADVPGAPGSGLPDDLRKAFEQGTFPDLQESPDRYATEKGDSAPASEAAGATEPEEGGQTEPEGQPAKVSGGSKQVPKEDQAGPEPSPAEEPGPSEKEEPADRDPSAEPPGESTPRAEPSAEKPAAGESSDGGR